MIALGYFRLSVLISPFKSAHSRRDADAGAWLVGTYFVESDMVGDL